MAVPLVDRHVDEGRGSRPALRLAQRNVSYAELQEHVNRAGNVMRAAGIQPEQRVVILLPDGLEFIASFLGAMKIGAVPVPLNTFARAADLEFMIDDSRARMLIVDAGLAGSVKAADRPGVVVGDGGGFASALERSAPTLEASA